MERKAAYFDKYRLDIDAIRDEAERKIRENTTSVTEKRIDPPSSAELYDLIPAEIQQSRDVKFWSTVTWKHLAVMYEDEVLRKHHEWSLKQKHLQNELKFKQNSYYHHDNGLTPFESKELNVSSDAILANPLLLETYSFENLLILKKNVENNQKRDLVTLHSAYTQDLKRFLEGWEKFRICKINLTPLNGDRVATLLEEERQELLQLNEQYLEMKKYLKDLPPKDSIVVHVNCKNGNYDFSRDEVKINLKDKVKHFIRDYLVNVQYDRDTSVVYATITGGPKMDSELPLANYNWSVITSIEVIIASTENNQ